MVQGKQALLLKMINNVLHVFFCVFVHLVFISSFWILQLKKEMASQVGPPGYGPELDAKPKTKSVKRNERKKEKRIQVCYVLSCLLRVASQDKRLNCF